MTAVDMAGMEIRLAGFNVDIDVLNTVAGSRHGFSLTPETLSAAYARISRSPKPVWELRREAAADVARARRSNERIVFGYGHKSVAEHAVFNFDVLGVSRLAVEALEHHRLASYTEKSQRYVKFDDDYVVPPEVADGGKEGLFRQHVDTCFQAYSGLLEGLVARGTRERQAGQDARYVLPLCTATQLGMTVNARELEWMVQRLACSSLAEVRTVGRNLCRLARSVAPSLIRYVDPTEYLQDQARRVLAAAGREGISSVANNSVPTVAKLLRYDADGEERILAALLSESTSWPFSHCLAQVKGMGPEARMRLFRAVFHSVTQHDVPPRAFEHLTLTFEMVLSASAFAQLKRHRMTTIAPGPYCPSLGITVPPSLEEHGMAGVLERLADQGARLWEALGGHEWPYAQYALLNCHRRRVLLTMNMRELYAFSRLRQDACAQWDIRNIADEMVRQVRKVYPLAGALLCGKHEFGDVASAFFDESPPPRP